MKKCVLINVLHMSVKYFQFDKLPKLLSIGFRTTHAKEKQKVQSILHNAETQATIDTWQRMKTKKCKHTTMKTKKMRNMLSLCNGNYHFTCTDDILSGMWLPFVQIKGNYYKNLLFESFIHTSVWSTVIIPSTLSKIK